MGGRMRERRSSPPTRRVGEGGRSVEGSGRMGDRRGWDCWCCCGWLLGVGVDLVGDAGLSCLASRRISRPGAEGGGSKGIVLSVLVLVTRRNSGPVGLWVAGDCPAGDGGGSEALDGMYGWIDRGIVNDTARECGRTGRTLGFGGCTTGPGARVSPWD